MREETFPKLVASRKSLALLLLQPEELFLQQLELRLGSLQRLVSRNKCSLGLRRHDAHESW
ncbi:MAG: hypothetical protein ACK55Z_25875, partial [bacterium]